MAYQIRLMLDSDWPEANLATFQSECPTWEEWDTTHLKACRQVVTEDGKAVGYREKIGRDRFGTWRNTVLMEKRSASDCFDGACNEGVTA